MARLPILLLALLLSLHSVAVVAVPAAAGGPAVTDAPAAGGSAAVHPSTAEALTDSAADAPAVAGGGAVRQTDDDIRRTLSLSLTPDRPGEIGVRVELDVPDRVDSLTMQVPSEATVTGSRGFDRTGDTEWSWNERTDSPSIRFSYPVNRSFAGYRSPARADHRSSASAGHRFSAARADHRLPAGRTAQNATGYSFVDTGPWAIAPIPQISTRWSYTGATVELDGDVVVDGEGATGGEMVYLGPATEYTRTASGQTFRLVVPRAAEMREEPEAVLDSLTDAAGSLAVGARDPEVFYVAAPTSVDWGPAGVEYGGSDSWVRDSARLDVPANIWLHEYVHTRTAYETTAETRWLREGPVEYYAALLTLEQGRIDFATFRSHLARGTDARFAESVLSKPSSWASLANYYKGAVAYGALDRRIRAASGGERSADAVLARLNRDRDSVTQSEFLTAVDAVGGTDAEAFAREYTSTTATPSLWSVTDHAAAFPGTPAVEYDLEASRYRVTGPYRNRSVSPSESLVTGETLRATVPVRNAGDVAGGYEVSLVRSGETVANASGSLPAGETANASLSLSLERPGLYTLSGGGSSHEFSVLDPSPIRVVGIETGASAIRPGETVDVRVTVASASRRPARGDVDVLVDGERAVTRSVAVDGGDSRTITVPVRLREEGAHEIRVGDRTAAVEVRAPTTETRRTTDLPWPTALAGLALGVLAVRRWASREREN